MKNKTGLLNAALIAAGSLFVLTAVMVWRGHGHQLWLVHNAAATAVLFILPLVLAVLFFVAVRFSPRAKLRLLGSLISIGLTVLVLETTLELGRRWLKSADGIDDRSRAEVVYDQRQRGVKAYPVSCARHYVGRFKLDGRPVLPLSSLANAFIVHCNESGQMAVYVSDEHGFNNPKGLWRPGKAAVMLVGDSMVLGDCVPPEKNMAADLRRRYPGTINVGCRGNGPLTMLATIREYGTFLKPRIVVWCYAETNDLIELKHELAEGFLTNYLDPGFSQGLVARRVEIDRLIADFLERKIARESGRIEAARRRERLWASILRLDIIRTATGLFFTDPVTKKAALAVPAASRLSEATFSAFEKTLARAKADVESWGGRLVFAYLPGWKRFKGEPGDYRYHDRIIKIADSLGLPIVDLVPVFADQPDIFSLFARGDSAWAHYNPAGYKLAAERIAAAVESLAAGPDK